MGAGTGIITALLMLLPAPGPVRWAALSPLLRTVRAVLVYTDEGPGAHSPMLFSSLHAPRCVSSSVEILLGHHG